MGSAGSGVSLHTWQEWAQRLTPRSPDRTLSGGNPLKHHVYRQWHPRNPHSKPLSTHTHTHNGLQPQPFTPFLSFIISHSPSSSLLLAFSQPPSPAGPSRLLHTARSSHTTAALTQEPRQPLSTHNPTRLLTPKQYISQPLAPPTTRPSSDAPYLLTRPKRQCPPPPIPQ